MASLKDLAPAEKQKVARLIRQVVDKERALKELEAAAAAAAAAVPADTGGSGDNAAVERAEALEEQNRELARENTSLRAKLSHAFDLLRTYQHKVRVLDATVALTGSAAPSRPLSPLGPPSSSALPAPPLRPLAALPGQLPAAGGTPPGSQAVDAQQLTDRLSTLCCSRGGSGGGADADVAPSCCGWPGGTPLSPVAEAACEGASPCPAMHPAPAAHAAPAAAGVGAAAELEAADGIQLVAPQAALPQLETLRLLARALLEAQAEVAARQPPGLAQATQHCPPQQLQSWQPHQPPPQQLQQEQEHVTAQQPWEAACGACCSNPAHLSGAAAVGVPEVLPQGAHLVFDPSLGPCGGFLISAQQSPAACEHAETIVQAAYSSSGEVPGWTARSSPAEASGRAVLAVLPPQQQRQQQQQPLLPWPAAADSDSSSSCGRALAFDDSLMDLVRDAENLAAVQQQQQPQAAWSGGSVQRGAGQPSGHAWSGGSGGSIASQELMYEENDLLALLDQL